MANAPHEAMHRIFQKYPGLFSRVSDMLGAAFPESTTANVICNDLTENQPLERRVDTLLRIETEHDGPFLLAVEAQGRRDPDKHASWAYYFSYLLAKYRLPTTLLVVCQDRATAEWAARPVRLGAAQWPVLTLHPLVAGPHNIPFVTDVAEARKDLALAALSAITHADNPDVGAILKSPSTALRDTPETIANPIIELTAQGLGNRPAAQQWRNLVAVDLSFYVSPLSEEIRDEGREEGRAEGQARSLLQMLELRGVDVPAEAREKIEGCRDTGLLDQWFSRAVTVTSAEDIFTEAGLRPDQA
ncbi:hypothetical protein [Streptomyces mutomycini]|uniref:Transposase n=1 Tax=Streptomyces mutomycini TaxID=284036 RepID=A0ABW0AXP0_9ACTN|nr:hypothetical protein [Streptomyces mutomycini]